MKRVLELAWAVLCAWIIHGSYTGSKERSAAAEDAQPAAAQTAAEQTGPEKNHATKEDRVAAGFSLVIGFVSVGAVLLIKPIELTRDTYLETVFAVASLTGIVLGISKVVERFRPESRFFATFERCMLLIAVFWASIAAIVAAKAG